MTFADRLEELRKVATPGEWEEGNDGFSAIVDNDEHTLYYDEGTATEENNALILFLVNNADAILELVRAAEDIARGGLQSPDFEKHAVAAAKNALAKLNGEQT